MLSKLETIKTGFYDYMTGIALASVRRELLTHSDHILAECGFSRELLEQGVSSWPWRATGTASSRSSARLSAN